MEYGDNTSGTAVQGSREGLKMKFFWLSLFLLLLFPSLAAGETASVINTLSGNFYNNAWSPARWSLQSGVSAPLTQPALLPTQKITLQLPDSTKMRWQPGKTSCPDNKIGPPPVNVSVPVEQILARCPEALIGNGEATFLLAGKNKPGEPSTELRAPVLAFSGGFKDSQPLIKFYAFSYDTRVGIYTEGALSKTGLVEIAIPVLSFDSSLNSLDFSIPGREKNFYIESADETVTLPAGKTPGYVQVRCLDGIFNFSAQFLLGKRLTDGTPSEPTSTIDASAENISCTGSSAKAQISKASVQGPGRVKRGQTVTYRVLVENSGALAASGVKVRASGPGVRGSSKTYTVTSRQSISLPVRFSAQGSIKTRFIVSSKNGGGRTAVKTIRVG